MRIGNQVRCNGTVQIFDKMLIKGFIPTVITYVKDDADNVQGATNHHCWSIISNFNLLNRYSNKSISLCQNYKLH